MTEVRKDKLFGLEYDQEGFRMTTPSEIAEYKARKLSSSSIADLGCGIGLQTIYFSKEFDSVVAVENNEERFNMALKNAISKECGNIRFIKGDVFSKDIMKQVEDVEIINADPSRKKSGEEWNFTDLSPNPVELMKEYKADQFSFDLPVRFKEKNIPRDWTKEYVSIYGEPKRLITYAGEGFDKAKTATALPSGLSIQEMKNVERNVIPSNSPKTFIHEVDQIVEIAGLVPEFLDYVNETEVITVDKQRIFATSEKMIANGFILRSYEILEAVSKMSNLNPILSKLKAGKVVPRFEIPSLSYYSFKRKLEEGLYGSETIYVFKFGGRYYLGKKVSEQFNR